MSYWFGYSGKKDPDLEDLPQYNTFNDLAPQFQLTDEHDENHIFPEERHLVQKVREQCQETVEWPDRYILIFLFARRHSIPHTIRLINKHLAWIKSLGFEPICKSKNRLYPFKPEELDDVERQYALFGGHTLYKHNLVDNHDRLLQYKIMRYWFPGSHSLRDYIATVLWWYYYTFQFVPLRIHRNGHAVVVDMKGMGWNNIDFSRETKDFLMNATAGLPGRMRVCWIVNSNWMLSTGMAVVKYLLSAKILARMHTVPFESLINEIPKENLPTELGGQWEPDLPNEWYGKVLEFDRKAEEERINANSDHPSGEKEAESSSSSDEKEQEKEQKEEETNH